MPLRITIPVFFFSLSFKLLPAEKPNTKVFNPINKRIKNEIIFIIMAWWHYLNTLKDNRNN
jgi:hypothetical protein